MHLKNYFSKMLLGLLLVATPLFAQENTNDTALTRFKNILQFGTYQQQVDALETLIRSDLLKTNRAPYESALALMMDQTENADAIKKFMEVISRYQLTAYAGYLEKIVTTRDARGSDATADDIALMTEALRRMNFSSNVAYAPLLQDFATNRFKHRDNPQLLAEAIRGVEIHKPADLKESLKIYLKNDETTELVQTAAIKAIAAYKSEDDLDYIQGIAKNPNQKSIVRWIAVVALGDFAPNEKAFGFLQGHFLNTDIDIKARALYALSLFKKPEVRTILLKSAKDNSPRIRGFAIKGLEKWDDAEINALLDFKAKNESEDGIKKEAIRILKDRNLWKEPEKKK